MNKLCFYIFLTINVGFISCSDINQDKTIEFKSAAGLANFAQCMNRSTVVPWRYNEYCSDIIDQAIIDLGTFGNKSQYFHPRFSYTPQLTAGVVDICARQGVPAYVALNGFERYLKRKNESKEVQFRFLLCVHAIIINISSSR